MSNSLGSHQLFLVLLVVLSLTACEGTPPPLEMPTPVTINQKILIACKGKPLKDAVVTLSVGNRPEISDRTDNKGQAILSIPSSETNTNGTLKIDPPSSSSCESYSEKFQVSLQALNFELPEITKELAEANTGFQAATSVGFPTVTAFKTDTPTPQPTETATFTPSPLPTKTPTSTPIPPTNTPTLAAPLSENALLSQIAFVREVENTPQIFLLQFDASKMTFPQNIEISETQITDFPYGACQPAWSPDGKILLFVSPCPKIKIPYLTDMGFRNAAIYKAAIPLTIAGSIVPELFISRPGKGAFDPAWAGSLVVYSSIDNNNTHIYSTDEQGDISGSRSKLLSHNQSFDSQPTLSQDGQHIAFRGDDHSNYLFWAKTDKQFTSDIYTYQPLAKDKTLQTLASFPSWSPISDQIVYVRWIKNDDSFWINKSRDTIVISSWTGGPSSEYSILNEESNVRTRDTQFSADGRWIIFSSWRTLDGDNFDIYYLPLSGGRAFPLTRAKAHEYQPAWRPSP